MDSDCRRGRVASLEGFMTKNPLQRIDYDGRELEAIEQAKPAWYRNLPGQMVGRRVIIPAPRRPPPLPPQFADPGQNPDQSNYVLLLAWNGRTDAPIPVSLSLRVSPVTSTQETTLFPPITQALFAGQNARDASGAPLSDTSIIQARNTGFVDLTYGVGGDQKRAVFDLRDGTFDLPPVSWVRVAVQRYAGGYAEFSATPPELAPGKFFDVPELADTIRDPLEVGASLHAGSHSGDYMPIFSSFFNQVNSGAVDTFTCIVPPRAREFVYGVPDDEQSLVNVTVTGAVQTRSRVLGGPTPGTINQPYWGPGIPIIPASDENGGTPVVRAEVTNAGPNRQLFYAGFRLGL